MPLVLRLHHARRANPASIQSSGLQSPSYNQFTEPPGRAPLHSTALPQLTLEQEGHYMANSHTVFAEHCGTAGWLVTVVV